MFKKVLGLVKWEFPCFFGKDIVGILGVTKSEGLGAPIIGGAEWISVTLDVDAEAPLASPEGIC